MVALWVLAALTTSLYSITQSAGTVEYTDCISAERKKKTHTHNECPGYDTKQSNGEVWVMLKL